MSLDETERVLVVPTALFHRLGHFQGFTSRTDELIDGLFRPENFSFRPRGQVEGDPSFKQLIPYVIFRYVDSDGIETVFQYTRGKGQGEARLHSKQSVGVGGHISSLDAGRSDNADPYREGMRRELDEEVAIDTPYTDRVVGMINDDQTDVGRVHLGVVHLFDVERPAVEPRESEILEAGFRPVEQLLAELDRFETWSSICLQALFQGE